LKDAERELLAVCSEVKQLQSKDDKVTSLLSLYYACQIGQVRQVM